MKGLLTPQPVRIIDLYDDGEECRHFTFEPVAGHTMQEAAPGQFFNLTVPRHGEAAFTYLSLPDAKGRFSALIRRTGSLTSRLFDCTPGTLLGYRGPLGHGWPMEQLRGRRVLVLAGGCGLPPLAAAIDALRPHGRIALIYGSRTPETRVMKVERAAWQDHFPLLESFDLAPPDRGRRTGTPLAHVEEALAGLGGEPEAVITCGPDVMMDAVGNYFTARDLPPDRIWLALERRMHCGVGLCGHCYLASSYVCTDGPVYRWDILSRLRHEMANTESRG